MFDWTHQYWLYSRFQRDRFADRSWTLPLLSNPDLSNNDQEDSWRDDTLWTLEDGSRIGSGCERVLEYLSSS